MIPEEIPLGDDTLYRLPNFQSQYTTARHVDVWLPPNYWTSEHAYPVVYMHDGQNVLDARSAMGHVDWGVREAVVRLMHERVIEGCMVVAIWNGPNRWRDFMPKPQGIDWLKAHFTRLTGLAASASLSKPDGYLRFIVEEVKPFVDTHYRTKPGQAHTFVMGSSMGGLISLYAVAQYPNIFGGAGCISTHWPAGSNGNALVDFFGARLPTPDGHKLYFDLGTTTLDAAYEPFQNRMDDWLRRSGYVSEVNWTSQKFEGAAHNEQAWRARVHVPLAFLLRDRASA